MRKKRQAIVVILLLLGALVFSVLIFTFQNGIFSIDKLDSVINNENSNDEFENVIFEGISWSPNSKVALIYGKEQTEDFDYQCCIYNYENSQITRLEMPDDVLDHYILKVQWSADNEEALISIFESSIEGGSGYLCVYNDGEISLLKRHIPMGAFAWSPNDDFALVSIEKNLYQYSNNVLTEIENSQIKRNFQVIEWNSDGSQAIMITEIDTVFIYSRGIISSPEGYLVPIPNNHNWWDAVWSSNSNDCLIVSSMGQLFLYNNNRIIEINSTPLENIRYNSFGVSWNPSGDKALIVGNDFNTGTHGYIIEYQDKNLSYICHDSVLCFEKTVWIDDNTALICARKGATIITRNDLLDDYVFDEWRSYGFLFKYNDGVVERIETTDLGEIGDLDYNEKFNSCIIVGALFIDGSWHTRIFTYSSVSVKDFSINKVGWLNDVAWSPNNEKALIVGLCGIILEFDGTNFTDLSVL